MVVLRETLRGLRMVLRMAGPLDILLVVWKVEKWEKLTVERLVSL